MQDRRNAKLLVKPGRPDMPAEPGAHPLGLAEGRDGLLYVPPGYRPDRPAPFIVSLHGAGGRASHGLRLFQDVADEAGLVVLAVDSRGGTWDMIEGGFGPDIAFLDLALAHAFGRCAVDVQRIGISGFSDGASYALSVGLANGWLFSHILAFSPGFIARAGQQGKPRIYISHGTGDGVLPIDQASRRLAPQLRKAGYRVEYHEFDGRHAAPLEIRREAVQWFCGK